MHSSRAPGDLPDPGIEPVSLTSPASSLPLASPGKRGIGSGTL